MGGTLIRLTVPKIAFAFAVVAVLCLLMRPLLPIDETRYLAVAWEMRLSGDPFHLTRNFASYSHKPPLLFWLINLVWLVTGVNEFAARLVGPFISILCLFATARLSRRLWVGESEVAVTAAAVLAGFIAFAIYGSTTMFDTMLTLAVVLGAGQIWRIGTGAMERPRWAFLGLCLGLGVYAKGPVVLIHLLPLLLTMPLWAPVFPGWRAVGRGFALSFGVGLALVALWLVPTLVTADAAFREELLWTQSAARVAGGMAHDRPFWFLFALLPILVFPFGWSLPFWRALPGGLRGDAALRFCGIWALSGLILFSFVSSKQAHYLVPELPALALMIARLRPGRAQVTQGLLAAGLGVTVLLHLGLWATGRFAAYDSARLDALLTGAPDDSLAWYGMPYNAEVNFTGRMRLPVATPDTEDDLRAWAVAHPLGLIVAPVKVALASVAPQETMTFNGDALGIWPAKVLLPYETPSP